MGWRVFGNQLLTSDFSGSPINSQPVKFNTNTVLRGMRTWLIFYNDPVLTSAQMKIYSNRNGSPGQLLFTSTNTLTKSEIITLENGVKEIYFDFDYIPMKDLETYQFALWLNGYTGTASSHVAWMKGWPDPVYRTGYTPTFTNLLYAPYQMYFIGADF